MTDRFNSVWGDIGLAPLLIIDLFGPEPPPERRCPWVRREIEHVATEKPLSKRAKRRLRGKRKDRS